MEVLPDVRTADESELVADEDTALALVPDSGVLADVEAVLDSVWCSVHALEKVEVALVATEDDAVLEPVLHAHVLAEVLVEDDTGFETDGDSVLDPVPVAEVIVMSTGELTVVDAVMLAVVEK